MIKYHYQEGMCQTLHYLSLNPVLYENQGEKSDFLKKKMDCNAIHTGKCTCFETCLLYIDAPEKFPYDHFGLLEKKLG